MAAAYGMISTQTLGSATSTITFSSIPQTYTDLVLVIYATNAQLSNVFCQIGNGSVDTGNNYSRTALSGNGSSVQANRYSNQSSLLFNYEGYVDITTRSNQIINFMNYSNTTTYKAVINRANNTSYATDAVVNQWRSTSAIDIIQITGNNTYSTGSTFALYGIMAA